MANKIQIKRSVANATVTGLSNGELAFTQAGNTLHIGLPDGSGVLRIGGAQYPGVLTNSQALVANATGGIDKVIVANAVITSLWANGSAGGAGDLLFSNGSTVYWGSVGSVGVNTASTYAWTNTHTFTAAIYANTVNAVAFTTTSTTINGTGVNSTSLSVGTSFIANSTKVVIGTSTGLQANGTVGTNGQTLYSNGTTVYWADAPAGNITGVTAGNGLTGGGTTGTVTLDVGAGNGITVAADSVAVLANSGLVANATGLHIVTSGDSTLIANATGLYVNDATLSIATSQLTGDVALGTQTSGSYVATITAGAGLTGSGTGEGSTPTLDIGAGNGITVGADSISVNGGSTLTVNTSGVHVNNSLSIADLSLTGNLTVLGTLTIVDTTNLTVKDSLIELANGNISADILDIGLYGQYAATGTRYTGIFRDASDGIYKLFSNSTVEPTTTVDTGAIGYTQGTLQSWLNSGGLVSNGTNVSITANSTLAVALIANTLSLSTALPGTSGGTGKATMTNNAILVGNSTNGYNELTLGTAGYVLQSNGSALIYDILDGGTF